MRSESLQALTVDLLFVSPVEARQVREADPLVIYTFISELRNLTNSSEMATVCAPNCR
jgi:hypothetical protein|tara:strand:- start:2962 stop:3135 length:174 start_codon:yes stop_codon:yes gene_type:complete